MLHSAVPCNSSWILAALCRKNGIKKDEVHNITSSFFAYFFRRHRTLQTPQATSGFLPSSNNKPKKPPNPAFFTCKAYPLYTISYHRPRGFTTSLINGRSHIAITKVLALLLGALRTYIPLQHRRHRSHQANNDGTVFHLNKRKGKRK